jgi:CubicO group peptidase (beta-lactamase class C family)
LSNQAAIPHPTAFMSHPAVRIATMLLAASSTTLAQSPESRLDTYLSARASLGQFNGTALVAQNGRVLLEKGYGFANFEHRVPAAASTRYLIASISKNFSDAALLRLQEEGRLSISDSLCKWISDCPEAWHPVTLWHLLHHTSGIPDYEAALELGSPAYIDYMSQSHSAERIVEAARAKPLDFPVGSKFRYSNTGYILLATVIEKASGQSFEAYEREHVLGPAGLTNMRFVSSVDVVPNLAAGYRRIDMDFARMQAGVTLDEHTLIREAFLPLDGPHGDGKLIASAHDLWQWTERLSDSTALTPASVRAMFTPDSSGYAAGWIMGTRFGKRSAMHTGAIPGYASVIEYYPGSRTVIVLLSNTTNIRLSLVLRDLAAIAFGQPYDVPVARQLLAMDTAAAASLNGEYALADGTTATVSAEKTMLGVKIPGRFEIGAFPVSADEFYAPFFDNTIRFERDANGRVAGIALRINGVTLRGALVR